MKVNRRGFIKGALATGATVLGPTLVGRTPEALAGGTVKVGILHSLSGTMAISEIPVKNAELMAIEEINAAGGVMGRRIEPVVVDGASDWPTFAQKARELISRDRVATVFGCWTSASRKAVKPVFEQYNNLLWYPVQYEGNECSQNIIYTGACPNQQIEPAVTWLLKNKGKKFFLVGSDYVFPRTANAIIKGQLKAMGGTLVGEEYAPLGHMEFATIVNKIRQSGADVVFSTINGDSNVAFYKQYASAGLTPEKVPILAVSVAEVEVQGIGPQYCKGHYASWNYFETTETPTNPKFVAEFKKRYGHAQVTDDPIEHGYLNVYLWKLAAEKARSFQPMKVRAAVGTVGFDAPQGKVHVDPANQNLYQVARVGEITDSGMFREVWKSDGPVKPQPYSPYISNMMCDWARGGLVKR